MGLGIGRLVSTASWVDLRPRLLSALVLGAAVLGLTVLGGVWYRLLCVATGVVVFDEWSRITRAGRAGRLFTAGRLALFASLAAFLFGAEPAALAIVGGAGLIIALIGRGADGTAWLVGGLAYAALASLAPGMLRGREAEGLAALGLVISVVWSTDIFAYFAGRTFGGPKLLPSVSPKKTLSGALGGLVAGVAFGTAFYAALTGGVHASIFVLTAALSVLGQAGDLFESWVKRRFGVKDSGRIIPGHGGLMDRIDALIVAVGAAWILGLLIEGFAHPARAIFDL